MDRTVAAYRYGGAVAAAVVSAKVGGAVGGWTPLGHELATATVAAAPGIDLVTWVPTEPGRRRARGVDHARSLAEPVAARLRRPLVATLRARSGVPDRGASADRARRVGVPMDAFGPLHDLSDARCLLVDDVLTTGDTAGRAAAVLRGAGAVHVHLAVLARAGRHRLVGQRPNGTPSD